MCAADNSYTVDTYRVEAVLQLEVDWKAARNNIKIKGEFDGWKGKFSTDRGRH